jgi:hypothetical protein
MVFALEVPELIRRFALILSQNNGLIESNSLVGVLQLGLHEFGCGEGRQTLFEL